LIGIDEAGRGALAGPVVAGAALVHPTFLEGAWCRRNSGMINDSKELSPEAREEAYGKLEQLMAEGELVFASGLGTVVEIEERNILGATQLAMRRALEAALAIAGVERFDPDPLFAEPKGAAAPGSRLGDWKVLIDGKPLRSLGFAHHAIVEGDGRSLSIAIASIVAKVTRDRMMTIADSEYPEYGFASHKGYATEVHRLAVLQKGPCPIHRALFLRKLLAAGDDPRQTALAFAEHPDAEAAGAVAEEADAVQGLLL
jgi:ribonuclease HII